MKIVMARRWTFYTDPYDPVVSQTLEEILKLGRLVSVEPVEQTVQKYTVELSSAAEASAEMEARVRQVSYVPLVLEKSPNARVRKAIERFLSTKIVSVEKQGEVYVPRMWRGSYIYRAPDEVFVLQRWLKKNEKIF